MTTKRPVGFLMAQALTVVSSTALFGLASFLNVQADVEAAANANVEPLPVVKVVSSFVPSGTPEVLPTLEESAASGNSLPVSTAPAPAAVPAPTPAQTPAPEPAPAPAPAPAPVDGTSSGS
jgi:hypothetical protein